MQRTIFFAGILLASVVSPSVARCDDPPKADAQPDPCVTDLTLEKLDNPPERKTKFEMVEEVWKERLVDVKAADQKFVAVIEIVLPANVGEPFKDEAKPSLVGRTATYLLTHERAREFTALQSFRGRYFLNPWRLNHRSAFNLPSDQQLTSERSSADALKRMLAQIPEERQPAKELREFFTASESNRLLISPPFDTESSDPNLSQFERHLRLLGTSPEEAEERARAFLSILDLGLSRPVQVALFKERVKHCASLAETNEKILATSTSSEKLTAMLKSYDEYTPDLLAGLRVQQLQMEVDLAGVKARISACDRLLANKDVGKDRLRQIEDAKVAAEIELAGFEARRAKAAEFVSKVKERNELTSKLEQAQRTTSGLRIEQDRFVKWIKGIDEEIAAFAPVRLVDDRVTIHPLEWTQ